MFEIFFNSNWCWKVPIKKTAQMEAAMGLISQKVQDTQGVHEGTSIVFFNA